MCAAISRAPDKLAARRFAQDSARPLERPIASHGQASNKVVLPLRREREERTSQHRKLLRQKCPVFISVLHIRIEALMDIRHHYGQTERRYVTLNGCSACPDGIIIRIAVKQVQGLMLVATFAAALPCRFGRVFAAAKSRSWTCSTSTLQNKICTGSKPFSYATSLLFYPHD